jgi:nitroreductase/NAD-dependent dihydropyrimidine dehydrogenase PreA subunit
MGLLIIDESKCKKDGICAGECPTAIIRLKDKEGYPEMVPGGEQFCLLCGHCVAVCPHGALNHAQVSIKDCPPIEKELVITEEQTVQFLRSRRSIRFFKDKPVEKEKIQRLIEIGRYAPTASNSQLVEWLVCTDQAKIKEMAQLTVDWMRSEMQKDPQSPQASYMPLIIAAWDAGYDAVLRGAPAMVLASAPKEASNGMVDLTLALSYFELAAPSLGIGTCWAGLLQVALLSYPPIKEALGLPEGHPHHYPMMVGYRKAKYFRLPDRKPPKITWR